MNNSYRIRILCAAAAVLLLAALVVSPGTAVKVEGAKIMYDVEPGTTYLFPMAVSIKETDGAADYAVDVLGFGQSLDGGSYTGLAAADDNSPYSARSFVTTEETLVHLEPGDRVAFNAVVDVPANVGSGGRYAIILIHPATTGGAQASFATAVAVPVMLTIAGTSAIETGDVGTVSVGEVVAGKPIVVTTALTNTGNHHYYGAVNTLSVTDAAGTTVATATSDPFSRAVIPGQTVAFETPLATGLPVGTYTVTSAMTLEDGTVLDEATATFTVAEEYIPPFTAATLTITPEAGGILAVPEGTVTISFPKGAVFAETDVTVAPYAGALPALPAGAAAGTTAFTVDGLTGLLAKDATVTVTYAAGDLAAAGGSASHLALARWDRGEGAWTLMPTKVDTGRGTLTATTNRFSTWAVVATDAAPAAPTGESGPGILVVVLTIAAALACAAGGTQVRRE
ncbi:hypothetical protein AZH53_09640 [Methanomicrobiaceae archaeon CYW5]|uniref:hypothetical protein n=1 Tax=Methanovulcanius yangii TaxID=1789227 RepID=UPI0029C9F840|nr:hypothetical protein [Methanovulcanius yangii]MBT8508666.1 hypothetical protein [Methanovulcanius yangii]